MLSPQLVQSMGVAIYRALDWGLDDSEERELSPQLERLIERMVGNDHGGVGGGGGAGNATTDEGYSGQEEEEEQEEDLGEQEDQEAVVKPVCTFRQVMALCAARLANPSLAPEHYQAVCRALLVETLELQTFLTKIRDAKEVRAAAAQTFGACVEDGEKLSSHFVHTKLIDSYETVDLESMQNHTFTLDSLNHLVEQRGSDVCWFLVSFLQ